MFIDFCYKAFLQVHRLPAEPNVVTILELYWKHYATVLLCGKDKPSRGNRASNNISKVGSEDIQSR